MSDSTQPQRSFIKTINDNPIPALILMVGTVSFMWAAVTLVFWKQIDSAGNSFIHAMTRMDSLFKDTGATSTNVQYLRDDLRQMRDDVRAMRDDIRDDVKNLREDNKIAAEELRKIRDLQTSREAVLQVLRENTILAANASRDAKDEATNLRTELRSAKAVEIQIVESYGIAVDEQLLVKFQKGQISVSPLTSEKTRQIVDANFIRQPNSNTSSRSWWSLPPGDLTSSIPNK